MPAGPAEGQGPTSTQARILVADATRVQRAVLAAQLAAHGYEVVEVPGGNAAIEAARTQDVDVVLLDADAPGEDAAATLDAFRSDPGLSRIPVVLVSRSTATQDLVASLERGAHDYLRKPVEPAELVARVHAAARLKALNDRLARQVAQLAHTIGTDPLTGLRSRRAATEEVRRLAARAARHGTQFGVLVAALDGFGALREQEGRGAADAAVAAVVDRLRPLIRGEDMLARWEIGELLLTVTDGGADATRSLAERILAAIADRPLLVEGSLREVTISVGWAAWRRDDEEGALLRRAEAALDIARAKANGFAAGDV